MPVAAPIKSVQRKVAIFMRFFCMALAGEDQCSLRHCEQRAAIHGCALSTMDRHGLRPRDAEGSRAKTRTPA